MIDIEKREREREEYDTKSYIIRLWMIYICIQEKKVGERRLYTHLTFFPSEP